MERITRPSGHVQVKRHIGGIAIETVGSADGGCGRSDAKAIQYVLRDHLGSVDVLTDAGGGIDRDMRFDAWGRRAAPSTGEPLADSAAKAFDHCDTTRGFTDHEMLDEVGIVHMNGRIYDPALGRFLQADPFVQFPGSVQSWNRYSYVMNNPLAYTDPSGHFVFSLAALVAVSAQQGITWYAAAAIVGAAGFGDALVQGASFGQALRSGLFSGLSAAAFTGIGAGLGTEFGGTFAAGLNAPGFGLKVALHGAVGGITSVLQGGRFGHGFAASGFTALASGINNSRHVGRLGFSPLRVAIGAAVGGTASRVTGGKFANGAVTGAFSQALNNERQEEVRQSILEEIRQAGEDPPPFNREQDVAFFLHERLHLISETHGIEIGARIYQASNGKWHFTMPTTQFSPSSVESGPVPEDAIGGVAAAWHTHPSGSVVGTGDLTAAESKDRGVRYSYLSHRLHGHPGNERALSRYDRFESTGVKTWSWQDLEWKDLNQCCNTLTLP